MKNILYFVIALPLFIISCSNEKVDSVKSNETDSLGKVTLVRNEDILAKTLLYTEWATVPSIMSMPYSDLRNSLISNLNN